MPAQKPLTLALSRRERGIDRVVLASDADLKYRVELRIGKAPIGSLSPSPPLGGEGWGEGGLDLVGTTKSP